MKLGKRSRKAQQEAKNKSSGSGDNGSHNSDEKHSRSSASVNANQSNLNSHRNGANEKVMTNLTNNNFHFSKSTDPSHLQPNSILPMQHQRHLTLPNNAKEVLANGVEESFASNRINRAQPNVSFINEGDDMIWRVV